MGIIKELASPESGKINPAVFVDPDIYQRELDRVFGKCWLYVGHESSLPNAGSYLVNYMGEDEVVVVRDAQQKLHVFLNKCRHRGNKVCLFDRGTARSFTCTYHGWQYDTQGKLFGVPFLDDAYLGVLPKESLGLEEVPRVESYKGLIFACWDAAAAPLTEFLGDITWYLDRLVVREELGGLEVVAGKQRYLMPANWKMLSDNFCSDNYHTPTSHASAFRVFAEDERYRRDRPGSENYQVTVGYPDGVPHGHAGIRFGPSFQELLAKDLVTAEELGPEAVDWVRERYARLEERWKDDQPKIFGGTNSHIFPNLSMIMASGGSAFEARGIIQWHMKGPLDTEVWQWAAVEKDAPKIVKEASLRKLIAGQAAAGLIAPDDSENFERSTDNLKSHRTLNGPFDYTMGLGQEESHPKRDAWVEAGYTSVPGLVGPWMSEVSQRQFYRYWASLVDV